MTGRSPLRRCNGGKAGGLFAAVVIVIDGVFKGLASVRHVATDALDGLAGGEKEAKSKSNKKEAHGGPPDKGLSEWKLSGINVGEKRAFRKKKAALCAAFALHALADKLARAANRFRLLAGALFGWLFVEFPPFHLAECAFALHFLLQRAKSLLDIIVADNDLNQRKSSFFEIKTSRPGMSLCYPGRDASLGRLRRRTVSCGLRRAGL
jgi:hypothetical protein